MSHDMQAERALLGAMLIDPNVDPSTGGTETDDFHAPLHRRLHAAMISITDSGGVVDSTTVASVCRGDATAISEIEDRCPTAANALHYSKIVRGHSRVRQYTAVLNSQIVYGASHDDTANEIATKLADIAASGSRAVFRTGAAISMEEMKRLEAQSKLGGASGLMTGFTDLDESFGGMEPGESIVIAGRPGMGKTALAMAIANHVSLELKKNVAIVSMEMTCGELVRRAWSSEGMVDSAKVRAWTMSAADQAKLSVGMNRMHQGRMHVNDGGAETMREIRSLIMRLHTKHPLELIVIDYLQLVEGVSKNAANREREVATMSRQFKKMCKEIGCPGLLVAQLNRGPENKPDKRPGLADLRESGAIEQDADKVVFVYRDEVYNPETKDENVIELIIKKQRNGPTGTIKLRWHGPTTSLHNMR